MFCWLDFMMMALIALRRLRGGVDSLRSSSGAPSRSEVTPILRTGHPLTCVAVGVACCWHPLNFICVAGCGAGRVPWCGAWCGAGVALAGWLCRRSAPCFFGLTGRRVHARIHNSLAAAGGAGVARALHPCGGGWLCSLLLVRRKLAFVLEVVFVGPGGHAVLPLHPAHLVSLLD